MMTKNNWKHLWESILYILLLFLFTYTPLVVECLKGLDGAYNVYIQNQSSMFSMFVNFGLFFMILIDYQAGKSRLPIWPMWTMAVLIIIYITMYGYAKVLANQTIYSEYELIINHPYMIIFVHICTILVLIFTKYKSVEEFTVSKVY